MIDHGYGVTLRRPVEADLDQMITWRNDSRVQKWCRQFDDLTWEEHIRWFKALDDHTKMYMISRSMGMGMPVGVCGLTSIDYINRRAEFSLYIGPENQHDFLGSLALMSLLTHGFKTYGFNVIHGEVFHGNPASYTFKNLGFEVDGIRRQFYFRDGRFLDSDLISMTAFEFQRNTWKQLLKSDSSSQAI